MSGIFVSLCQTLQGYIFHLLQHFATNPSDVTKFKMLFRAVLIDSLLLAWTKIYFIIQIVVIIQKCVLLYKVLNEDYSPCLSESFVRLTNLNRGYNLRNDETDLALPKPKTNFLKRSFKYSASMLWNNLSLEAKTATSLRQFKQNVANCCL